MNSIASLVLSALLVVSSSATVLKHGPSFDWNKIRHVYAFGDSYSYVQGTNGYPKFSFIGSEFNQSFTPHEILTDEILYHNTSSGGANWLQFLTSCYEGTPLHCPRQLWDFAYSGADISGDLLPLHHNHTLPLVDQVELFVKYGAHILPHPADETLVTWWIGINDCGDAATNTSITDYNKFWEEQMNALFTSVAQATTSGRMHSHLFLNVPPKEREPSYLGDEVRSTAVIAQVQVFNTAFARSIEKFKKDHPQAVVLSYDAHAFFNRVLDDPEKYGFGNVTGYCSCPDDQYFWWNNGHPTEKLHKLLAEDIEHLLVAGK